LPGLKEPFTLLAAHHYHVAWPGLPQLPLAALHLDWFGVAVLAD